MTAIYTSNMLDEESALEEKAIRAFALARLDNTVPDWTIFTESEKRHPRFGEWMKAGIAQADSLLSASVQLMTASV